MTLQDVFNVAVCCSAACITWEYSSWTVNRCPTPKPMIAATAAPFFLDPQAVKYTEEYVMYITNLGFFL